MTNVALVKEVADWAEYAQTHQTPVGFDMADWIQADGLYDGDGDAVPVEQMREGSCETAACVAGYVAITRAPKGTTTTGSTLYLPDGGITDCGRFAKQELDITRDQASAIFYCGNETAIARLRYLAEHPNADGYDLADVYAD